MGNVCKILVVDDEPEVRAAMRRTIASDDLHVTEACDAQEALELMQDATVHVVLADHNMPTMTGLELLREVQTKYPAVIRLLITARADVDLAVKALNAGAVHRLLLKPWNRTDIPVILRKALERANIEPLSTEASDE